MIRYIFLALFVFTIFELFVLIQLARIVSISGVFLEIFISFIFGIWIFRKRKKTSISHNDLTKTMLKQITQTFSVILLVIPGIFTDLLGLLFLIPQINSFVFQRFFKQKNHQKKTTIHPSYQVFDE